MGIYRLSNGTVKRGPANSLFSADDAFSIFPWGNGPGQLGAPATSAKGAFQIALANRNFVPRVNCAFSAGDVLLSQLQGRCPRVTITLRRRRDRLLSRGTGFIFNIARVCALVFAIAPLPIFAAAKNYSVMRLPRYKAVPVHYGPMNKMIMSVRINSQPANLLVDTGSDQLIVNAEAAESFGVRPSQRGFRYIRYTQIDGELLPIAFVQNLSAGPMNFGSSPVTLRSSNRFSSGTGAGHVDGVLGLDMLLRHKAVINCRTKLVFFKVDPSRSAALSPIAASEKFTRVPIRREDSGALTVSCSIRGQSARLLVDTGAFVTTLHEGFVKSLGLVSEPTRISAQFGRGASKRISATKIDDLNIGGFKVPAEKFGVTSLPQFALQQGNSKIAGILGLDTLYNCHAIIDLDSMSLFLK
jgi:predicted aspartyl protease